MSTNATSEAVASDLIKSVVERVENLEREKRDLVDQIKEVFVEAKGNGLDVKALRAVVALRRQDTVERQEAETILDLYKTALGMS